ncbi:MAG: hypothetical protein ABIT76_15360 [Chthoniobacterales bacterium]
MKAHEIYQRISPTLNEQLLTALFASDKPAYKATLVALGNQRKLRPVYLERKPRAERHAWMQTAMSQKVSDEIALNLLQFWLLTSQQPMLTDFLDALGIKHDGKGAVEEMPESPDREKLAGAIEILLGKYPHENVAVYLHTFQSMNDPLWAPLDEILASEPRLALPSK